MKRAIVIVALAFAAIADSANAAIVDPFTTAGFPGGAGAVWTSIQPGTLFNLRQLQRFNSATTALNGDGAWTATLPVGSSSVSKLRYRQDNDGSTIDLSEVASMSFDVNVTGSVYGYWFLGDPNGFIAEVPGGFALSAGTHTVTLDISTAAIDEGFDQSAVDLMEISIAAASANSSFSVSNLQYFVGDGFTVGAEDSPSAFTLAQNHPNPFNPSTVIAFNLAETGAANLSVYDLAGRKVATLVDGLMERGQHNVTFDAGQLASGLYFYTLTANGQALTQKMVLAR